MGLHVFSWWQINRSQHSKKNCGQRRKQSSSQALTFESIALRFYPFNPVASMAQSVSSMESIFLQKMDSRTIGIDSITKRQLLSSHSASVHWCKGAHLYHFTLRSLHFVVPLSCDPSALIQVFTSMFKYDLHVKLRLGDLSTNWEHGDRNTRKTLHKPIIILSWFPLTKRQIVQWSTTPFSVQTSSTRVVVLLPNLGSVGRTAVRGQFWVDACGQQIKRRNEHSQLLKEVSGKIRPLQKGM